MLPASTEPERTVPDTVAPVFATTWIVLVTGPHGVVSEIVLVPVPTDAGIIRSTWLVDITVGVIETPSTLAALIRPSPVPLNETFVGTPVTVDEGDADAIEGVSSKV